jgi:hypothetical protein
LWTKQLVYQLYCIASPSPSGVYYFVPKQCYFTLFFLLRKHELTYFPDCIRSIEHSDKCIQEIDVEDAMYYPERT